MVGWKADLMVATTVALTAAHWVEKMVVCLAALKADSMVA